MKNGIYKLYETFKFIENKLYHVIQIISIFFCLLWLNTRKLFYTNMILF